MNLFGQEAFDREMQRIDETAEENEHLAEENGRINEGESDDEAEGTY